MPRHASILDIHSDGDADDLHGESVFVEESLGDVAKDLCQVLSHTVHVTMPSSQKALELIVELRQRNLESNVIIYSTAISACEKTKPSQKTLELIEEMQQKGLAALSLMRRQGLQHITITYNFLISEAERV